MWFSRLEEDCLHNTILIYLYNRKRNKDNCSWEYNIKTYQSPAVRLLLFCTISNNNNVNVEYGQYTPGVRKRFNCLWSRTWFWWFPLQKFCRNVCARVMTTFIFSSLCANKRKDYKTECKKARLQETMICKDFRGNIKYNASFIWLLLTFSKGICSRSSTTVWAPMFFSSLCCCTRLFLLG